MTSERIKRAKVSGVWGGQGGCEAPEKSQSVSSCGLGVVIK